MSAALWVAAACHLATIAALACIPLAFVNLGWINLTGVAAIASLMTNERRPVKPDDPSRVNEAFSEQTW